MKDTRHKVLQLLLGKWFFAWYSVMGLAYFVLFPLIVPGVSCKSSFFMMLALMTGSDPYSFKETIENHTIVWSLAWIIHMGSWLFMPALISLVVADVADDIKKEQRLEKRLQELVIQTGVPSQEAAKLVSKLKSELDKMIDETGVKGGMR